MAHYLHPPAFPEPFGQISVWVFEVQLGGVNNALQQCKIIWFHVFHFQPGTEFVLSLNVPYN